MVKNRRQSSGYIAVALMVVLIVIGFVLISPVLLKQLAGRRATWADVGNIGQAYGGAAALLAAVALIGVAVSVSLQLRAIKIQRISAIRSQHIEIVKLEFDHPLLI